MKIQKFSNYGCSLKFGDVYTVFKADSRHQHDHVFSLILCSFKEFQRAKHLRARSVSFGALAKVARVRKVVAGAHSRTIGLKVKKLKCYCFIIIPDNKD